MASEARSRAIGEIMAGCHRGDQISAERMLDALIEAIAEAIAEADRTPPGSAGFMDRLDRAAARTPDHLGGAPVLAEEHGTALREWRVGRSLSLRETAALVGTTPMRLGMFERGLPIRRGLEEDGDVEPGWSVANLSLREPGEVRDMLRARWEPYLRRLRTRAQLREVSREGVAAAIAVMQDKLDGAEVDDHKLVFGVLDMLGVAAPDRPRRLTREEWEAEIGGESERPAPEEEDDGEE